VYFLMLGGLIWKRVAVDKKTTITNITSIALKASLKGRL